MSGSSPGIDERAGRPRAGAGRPRAGAGRPRAGAAGPSRDFALALERYGSGTAVLVLAGELDLFRAPEVEDALGEVIGPEPDVRADGGQSPGEDVRHLAVDLRSVTFIDSTTLALLLSASRRQHARGGELHVLVGPRTPMTAFKVTGFDRLLRIKRVDDDLREGTA